MSFDSLQKKINYSFKDEALLKAAFTHRSANSYSYERLEFLGDNVLGMIISEYLYLTYPNLKEGKLSRMRSHLVRSESLRDICRELKLYQHIVVKKFKDIQLYDLPDSLLADIVESLIGAIYMDSDYDTVKELVLFWFNEMFKELDPDDRFKDPKTALQECLQSQGQSLPIYDIENIDEENHVKRFHVVCKVGCYDYVSRSSGTSKKVAEQAAAAEMMKMIKLHKQKSSTNAV